MRTDRGRFSPGIILFAILVLKHTIIKVREKIRDTVNGIGTIKNRLRTK